MTVTAGTGAHDLEESCNQWEMAAQLYNPCATGCRVTRFLQEMQRALQASGPPGRMLHGSGQWHHLLPQLGLTEACPAINKGPVGVF